MSFDNRDAIFSRLGAYVKWSGQLTNMKAELDPGILGVASSGFDLDATPSSEEDKAAYEAISIEAHRQAEDLESLRQNVVGLATQFFAGEAKSLLKSTSSTPQAVIDDLIRTMSENGNEVLENTVSSAPVTASQSNSVSLSSNISVNGTQMARTDQFSLTCIDDVNVGQERWALESARLGQCPDELVTGSAFACQEAGVDLTIPQAPAHDEVDTSGKVANWNLSGAVRGTTVAADGSVYLKFHEKPDSVVIENDDLNQLSALDFSSTEGNLKAVFGEESDADGKLYVSVVKEPAVVMGGAFAAISESSIDITGATDDNTNHGVLYAKVARTNASNNTSYTVTLYKDSSRTTVAVASGTSGTLPKNTIPSAAIELSPTSGLGGYVVLDAFFGNDTDGTITDDTIVIKVPRYCVRVYRSDSRSEGDLVSQGVSYVPAATDMYLNANSALTFQTKGKVTLNYLQDNENIIVSGVFHTIDMWRADPNPSVGAPRASDIVARAGSTATLLEDVGQINMRFYEVNGSGLTNASVDLTTAVSNEETFSAKVGFAKGDKFTFGVTVSDQGQFQTFLRDSFGKVLPSAASGNLIAEP